MESLFQEFKKSNASAWEEKILEDLDKLSLEELHRKNEEGVSVKPFYTAEEYGERGYSAYHFPGQFPFLRGYRRAGDPWKLFEEIKVNGTDRISSLANKALKSGVDILSFVFPDNPDSRPDIGDLMKELDVEGAALVFENNLYPKELWASVKKSIEKANVDKSKIDVSLNFDPLGFLALHGDYPDSESSAFSWVGEMLLESMEDKALKRSLLVDGSIFYEAGGTAVHEIAVALAMGKEYLEIISDRGIAPEDVFPRLGFRLAAGKDFFTEIAKLRAFRMLWSWIAEAYATSSKQQTRSYVHSRSAFRNISLYDSYVNILRVTTSAMSAIIGGADAVTTLPFDSAVSSSQEFSSRISRNIQLILKYESYFDKIADPSAGSYYVEVLTRQVAARAWDLFREIEKAGGYRNALKEGSIQHVVGQATQDRMKRSAFAREVLIGTNRYPKPGEQMVGNVSDIDPMVRPLFPGRRVNPLVLKRISEPFDVLRLRTEKSGSIPRVFLLGLGNPALRAGKVSFAANFFAIAGFEILESSDTADFESGVEEIKKHEPEIVVFCTSPEDYLAFESKVPEEIKEASLLVFAGDPGEDEEIFRKSGIKFFVHRRSNMLEVLTSVQEALGIK